jgi:hypothetical protein
VCNGLLKLLPLLSTLAWVAFPAGGYSVSVSLPCTNPALFPLYQYTSKLLSCKVTSEVLFNLFVLILMHAWPRCMLLWFAISCCVKWEWQEKWLVSICISCWLFSELGDCVKTPQSMLAVIHCAVLCCAVSSDQRRFRPPMDLEDIWTTGYNWWMHCLDSCRIFRLSQQDVLWSG